MATMFGLINGFKANPKINFEGEISEYRGETYLIDPNGSGNLTPLDFTRYTGKWDISHLPIKKFYGKSGSRNAKARSAYNANPGWKGIYYLYPGSGDMDLDSGMIWVSDPELLPVEVRSLINNPYEMYDDIRIKMGDKFCKSGQDLAIHLTQHSAEPVTPIAVADRFLVTNLRRTSLATAEELAEMPMDKLVDFVMGTYGVIRYPNEAGNPAYVAYDASYSEPGKKCFVYGLYRKFLQSIHEAEKEAMRIVNFREWTYTLRGETAPPSLYDAKTAVKRKLEEAGIKNLDPKIDEITFAPADIAPGVEDWREETWGWVEITGLGRLRVENKNWESLGFGEDRKEYPVALLNSQQIEQVVLWPKNLGLNITRYDGVKVHIGCEDPIYNHDTCVSWVIKTPENWASYKHKLVEIAQRMEDLKTYPRLEKAIVQAALQKQISEGLQDERLRDQIILEAVNYTPVSDTRYSPEGRAIFAMLAGEATEMDVAKLLASKKSTPDMEFVSAADHKPNEVEMPTNQTMLKRVVEALGLSAYHLAAVNCGYTSGCAGGGWLDGNKRESHLAQEDLWEKWLSEEECDIPETDLETLCSRLRIYASLNKASKEAMYTAAKWANTHFRTQAANAIFRFLGDKQSFAGLYWMIAAGAEFTIRKPHASK